MKKDRPPLWYWCLWAVIVPAITIGPIAYAKWYYHSDQPMKLKAR